MAGRLIGDAFIAILPETTAFRSQADAQIKRSLGTLTPRVKIGADTREAQGQVAALAALIKSQKFSNIDVGLNTRGAMMDAEGLLTALMSLRERAEDIPVSTDDSRALSSILTMSAAAGKLAEQLVDMKADADITPILAKYYALDAKTRQLQADLSHLDPDMNTDAALTKLAELRLGADQLNNRLMNLSVDADDSQAVAKFAQLQVQVGTLAKQMHNVPMDADVLPIEAKLLAVKAQIEALDKLGGGGADPLSSVGIAGAATALEGMKDRLAAVDDYLDRTGTQGSASFTMLKTAINDAGNQLLKLDSEGANTGNVDAIRNLDSAVKQLGTDTGLTAADASGAAQGFGILGKAIAAIKNTHIDLFGGALSKTPLPNFLTQASGIHLLVEGVVELTAVWGPMLVGLTAFGLLAYKTGRDVYDQFTNMNTVVEATKAKFQGLTGGVQKLESAIQPQVMQLFGDYLTVAGNQGSHFKDVMVQIGTVLDNFGAKIAIDLNSQKTSTFLSKAASDVQGVGVAFGDIGRIIHTLLQAVPGYAEMLLKLGDGFLGMAANATAALEPVIAWFLKLHGAIFYLGLASTAVLTLGRSFAAAAIDKGAAGLSESFTGMAMSANKWAGDFTSDNEKVAAAAGNSGSRLGTWAQGVGGLFGSLINGSIKVTSSLKDMFAILTGSASVVGLAGGINTLEGGLKGLVTEGKITVEGMYALEGAMTGLKGASTDAAGIQVLNDAIKGLKDSDESAAAVEVLQKALGGMSGGTGLAEDAEGAGQGVGRFSQVLSKVPGFGMDAEKGVTLFGGALSALPLIPVAAGVAVLAGAVGIGLYLAFRNTANDADKLQASLQKMVATSDLANVQQNIGKAITDTGNAIRSETQAIQGMKAKIKETGGASLVNPQDIINTDNYTSSLKENEAAFNSWVGTDQTVTTRFGSLKNQFGGLTGAVNILNLAGVKQSDVWTASSKVWAVDEQMVNATAQAYGFMNQAAGTAANHLATLTIASGNTTKATQALVSAEQAWISLVTGGDSAFTTFEQGQTTLAQAMASGSKSGAALTVRIGDLSNKYKLVGTAMNGTSQSALAARAAFDQQLQSGVGLYGALQNLSAASGNTGKAQGEVAKGGKDIVAQMLPMAAGSKEATAELYALAQVAGYTGKDSFAALAKWAGTAKGAEGDLNQQQTKLTLSSANLTQAAKNLGNAVINEVTQLEAAKVASGSLQGAVNGLFNQFKDGKGAVTKTAETLASQYVNALKAAGSSQQNATQMLNAYLKTLGYTPSAIDKIDASLGTTAKAAQAAQGPFTDFANKALKLTATQATNLWGVLKQNTLATVQGHADTTESAFVSLASKGFGLTTTQAQEMWTNMKPTLLDTMSTKAGTTQKSFEDMAEKGFGLSQSAAASMWTELREQYLDTVADKAGTTKSAFIDLAEKALNLTNTEAGNLWTTLRRQYLDDLSQKAGTTKGAFVDLAEKGLGISQQAADNLWTTLRKQYLDTVANKAGTTKSAFVDLAEKGLGISQQAADNLWGTLRKQYLDTLVAKGDAAKNKFIDLAENGLNLSSRAAGNLWNTMKDQYLDTLSQKAGETESQFIKTAESFGESAGQAKALWQQLKAVSGNYGANVTVQVSGGGTVTANVNITDAITQLGGQGVLNPTTPAAKKAVATQAVHAAEIHPVSHAAGGVVRGGIHGMDSVHTMLAPGELVIPSSHAPKFADEARKAGIPGFAAGGLISPIGNNFSQAGSIGSSLSPITEPGYVTKLGHAVAQGLAQGTTEALSNAESGGSGGGSLGSGGGGGGGNAAGSSAASGSAFANAETIMRYLAQNLFGGNLRAAAGAVAAMGGESGWNPESAGDGGYGLIGLTYGYGDYPALTGNASRDMDAQLPGIIRFVDSSGDQGVITAMERAANQGVSLDTLAQMWGHGVERYGKNDVHAYGLNTAATILSQLQNGKGGGNGSSGGGSQAFSSDGINVNLNGFSSSGGGGNVGLPGSVGHGESGFFSAVLSLLHAPSTTANINALAAWASKEEPQTDWFHANNPLNTTLPMPGAGSFNSVGVRSYTSLAQGAEATAQTLEHGYSAIIDDLRTGRGIGANAAGDLSKWSGGGYSSVARGGIIPDPLHTAVSALGKFNDGRIKPHSGGGVINEPVYGFGANSGMPYSFAENGQPEFVSNAGQQTAASTGMPGATSTGQQQTNVLLSQMIKLLQQQPQALSQAIGQSAGSGVHHGYYGAQS